MTLGRIVERAASIFGDLRDHRKTQEAPHSFELSPRAVKQLRERLLPQKTAEELLAGTAHFKQGSWYEQTSIVGTREQRTQHPHRFSIMRLPESLEVLFLDPEHEVGVQSGIRPKVVNLMACHLFRNSPSEVAILRYRVDDGMRMKDGRSVDHLDAQWDAAKHMIDRHGIPPELVGRENAIIYRAVLFGQHGTLQSRYVNNNDLRRYAEHGDDVLFLSAKDRAQRTILERCLRHIREGSFHERTDLPA
jgi:hypothetical protein